jgi:hypothetical protein
MKLFRHSGALVFSLLILLGCTGLGASWESTLTNSSPRTFSTLRPLHAKYRFGWSGFTGGFGEVRVSKAAGGRLQVDARLQTIGLARTLWKYDASNTSTADAGTLRPLEVRTIENDRSKKIVTICSYDSTGVTSKELETPGKDSAPTVRRFDAPNLFDLQTGLFYLRSQPLEERNVQRIVVYPGNQPYLATITVLGRERLTVPAGTYNAIKLDMQLSKIGKDRELKPYKKFRRATAWFSDDADRVLLRIEAQVFVGTVFGELQSVEFENAKPRLRPD